MRLPRARASASAATRVRRPALLALAAALAGQALVRMPAAEAAVECKAAADCQYNGVCVGATCRCSPGWSGNACGTLAVAPAAPANGLRQTYPNGSWTSTWGGSIRRGGGAHYLLAAEITNGCPVKQFATNSRAALAVSRTGAAGPYTRLRTAIPVEAHNIQTVELPDGSVVAFTLGSSEIGGAANKGGPPKDCRHTGPPPPAPPSPAPAPTCGQRGWAGGA